jgi:hypothetical protein
MGTRDAARRLSHGRPHRGRHGEAPDRSGLDSTAKYPATAAAFAKLKVTTAYQDGELGGVRSSGVTSLELMQQGGEGLRLVRSDAHSRGYEGLGAPPLRVGPRLVFQRRS